VRCTVTATGGGGSLESALNVAKNIDFYTQIGAGASAGGDRSGAGGSGVVILSFPTVAGTITFGTGLTGTTTTSGANTIATITAGSGVVSWA
jgi:hypothetical protein